MTPEVRSRYDDALERLRGVVSRTTENSRLVKALLRDAAARMMEALEEDLDADLSAIIEQTVALLTDIVEGNMRDAALDAYGDEEDDDAAFVALTLAFAGTDTETPVRRYAAALSQEVKWFAAAGFAATALRDFLKDPQGFLAAESMKPDGGSGRQGSGRMTLAPVFRKGKRRRSVTEVLRDFRDSVPSVGAGGSYDVGRSAWTLLNATAMTAYDGALGMKWAGRGAMGYYVFRASTYDCPDCDEQCGWLHPLSDMAVPVHPNCCCLIVEAYPGETAEDFN